MSYDDVAAFAQQGGALYFITIFLGAVVYALWPRNGERFRAAARMPLDEEN